MSKCTKIEQSNEEQQQQDKYPGTEKEKILEVQKHRSTISGKNTNTNQKGCKSIQHKHTKK